MATHSSTLTWKISWTEEPGRIQSMGLQRVRHDWATSLSFHLIVVWNLLSRCGVRDCSFLGAGCGASFLHAESGWAPLLLQCVFTSLVVVGDFSQVALGDFVFLSSWGGASNRVVVGLLLSSSNVQGGFCLVVMCGWLNYLWHGTPLSCCGGSARSCFGWAPL